MMNISWLKLDVNILDDSKIKIIRSFPDGDSIVVLWIGLLCLAMKSHDPGVICITEALPYTIDDLSNLFDIEKKTVELGLGLFVKYQMIEQLPDGSLEVINFASRQNIELIEHKRELNRARVARHREKQCNALLTHDSITGNATDKIRLEKNKKKKEEKIRHLDSVLLTEVELKKLHEKFGESLTTDAIEILNTYIMSKGKKYKSHYHTIIGWPIDKAREKQSQPVQGGNNGRYQNRNRIPEPITRETQEGIDRINRMARELAQRQALDKA